MAEVNKLPEGTILNKEFKVVRVLGEGGFGITYLCKDRTGNETLAIKEYFPGQFANRRANGAVAPMRGHVTLFEKFSEGFWVEGNHLSTFDHPSIVHVVKRFEQFETRYLVMQLIEGPRLADHIKKHGSLAPDVVMLLAEKLIDALKEIHSQSLVHRDIKPGNIILRPSKTPPPTAVEGLSGDDRKYFGRPVLLDFGSARVVDRSGNPVTIMYTPEYAAPEQFDRDAAPDERIDIFGLAATLFTCLTGNPPVSVERRKNGTELRLLADTMAGAAPAAFLTAIDKALSLDMHSRQKSIMALEEEMFA